MKKLHICKSKLLVLITAFSLFVSCTIPLNTDAATTYYSYTITKSSGFSKKWSKSTTVNIKASGLSYPALITYGFDTWCTNEDYVTNVGGMPTGCKCKGTVTNSKGKSKSTSNVNAGRISGKADVKHTGTAKYKVTMWFS